MVGESRHNAVYFLVIEQFLVAASYRQLVAGNFPRQREAAVVDVGCSGTFGAAQLDGLAQQGRALATDTDYAEANAVISGTRFQPDLLSALGVVSDIHLVAARVMQVRDLPVAVRVYPNSGETYVRVRTQAGDYSHVAVMVDFLFQIRRRNANRASGLYRRYLLRLGLRFFTIGDNGEIIGFQAGEGVAITAIVCLHPLLFDRFQTGVVS